MKISYLNKSFVIIVLLLMISSFYTHPIQVRAHTEKNEIYLQFLGMPSLNSKKIIPTEQQITTLTQTISDIRNKMECTQSFEDALIIFADALDIFHKSAILTDIQHDKTLQTLTLLKPIFEHRNIDNPHQTVDQNTTNYLCLITGETTNSKLVNIVELSSTTLLYILFIPLFIAQFIGIGHSLNTFISLLRDIHNTYQNIRPSFIPGIGTITLGTRHISPSPPNQLKTYPALGWIKTIGLRGQTYINGSFIGDLRSLTSPIYDNYITYFLGATGFLGINIIQNNGENFFLGFALHLKTIYHPQPPYP